MTNGHDFDAELRDARAAVLELETRALNAERALEQARDEIASLRAIALGPAEHAGCVPLADVRHLLALCETYARHNRDATSEVLDALAFFVVERTAAEKRGRPNWQCSGCGWAFDGAWKKTCPCCDRENYWTGSVFPGALWWDGSRGTSVPHRGAESAEGGETGGG